MNNLLLIDNQKCRAVAGLGLSFYAETDTHACTSVNRLLCRILAQSPLKISVLRGLAKRNGGLTISNSPSPITQTRSE